MGQKNYNQFFSDLSFENIKFQCDWYIRELSIMQISLLLILNFVLRKHYWTLETVPSWKKPLQYSHNAHMHNLGCPPATSAHLPWLHIALQLFIWSSVTLLLPLNSTSITQKLYPQAFTSSITWGFFKAQCHIYCGTHVFLNHWTNTKRCYCWR